MCKIQFLLFYWSRRSEGYQKDRTIVSCLRIYDELSYRINECFIEFIPMNKLDAESITCYFEQIGPNWTGLQVVINRNGI